MLQSNRRERAAKIRRARFLVVLVAAAVWWLPTGAAAAGTHHPVVPRGWKTYRFDGLHISAPGNWFVQDQSDSCPVTRPGILELGFAGPSRFCPWYGITNIVSIIPTSEPHPTAQPTMRLNGLSVSVMPSGSGTVKWLVGGLQINGYGPQAPSVMHTIRA